MTRKTVVRKVNEILNLNYNQLAKALKRRGYGRLLNHPKLVLSYIEGYNIYLAEHGQKSQIFIDDKISKYYQQMLQDGKGKLQVFIYNHTFNPGPTNFINDAKLYFGAMMVQGYIDAENDAIKCDNTKKTIKTKKNGEKIMVETEVKSKNETLYCIIGSEVDPGYAVCFRATKDERDLVSQVLSELGIDFSINELTMIKR